MRKRYARLQNGKCHYCGELLTGPPPKEVLQFPIKEGLFPENFFDHPQHLHHDHDTGMTIGTVHARCNAVLWQKHGE